MPATKRAKITDHPGPRARRGPQMSDAHKAALAKGREEGRAVRLYLEALESGKRRPGRQRTPENIKKRLAALNGEIDAADSFDRLHLVQQRRDLEASLAKVVRPSDLAGLEKGFVKAAKGYGERRGIAYSTWRMVGVRSDVLQKAGIARTRS
jgi:hypothetical protein